VSIRAADAGATDAFRVDPWTHRLGGLVCRHPQAWIRLGNLETRLLADELEAIDITAPIYIAGLARAGSTLLLEILARHPQVASHRYSDFPMLFTPWAWQRFLDRVPKREAQAVERAHGDGIPVTPASPEAFEEMLWMAFFPRLHDQRVSAVLDGREDHPAFERFYRDHIRKLLFTRQRQRYVGKGNYNVTRLEYLLRIAPDARFVVPVRDPCWHIASLMKQHRLFLAGQRAHPRAVTHLQRAGHFEFGQDRRPVNAGDPQAIEHIEQCWREGSEVAGWAHYWNHIHGFLADRLDANADLRAATRLVSFEQLCRDPEPGVRALLAHCALSPPEGFAEREAEAIRFPAYYRPGFAQADLDLIQRITGPTAARLGVETAAPSSGADRPRGQPAP